MTKRKEKKLGMNVSTERLEKTTARLEVWESRAMFLGNILRQHQEEAREDYNVADAMRAINLWKAEIEEHVEHLRWKEAHLTHEIISGSKPKKSKLKIKLGEDNE